MGYHFNRDIEPTPAPAPRKRDYIRVWLPKRLTIADIQRVAAEHFGIPVAEMTSDRRGISVARPRQVAMYLAKQKTPRSLPEIGRRFGGRDHTTVIWAIRRIDQLRAADPEFDDEVRELEARL